MTTNTKVDRREIGRERKALRAAQLDRYSFFERPSLTSSYRLEPLRTSCLKD